MTDFAVVPASLRRMVIELEQATEGLTTLSERITDLSMNSWDLGPQGLIADYPDRYHGAKTEFADKVDTGAKRIGKVATALGEVADYYTAKDDEYYREFGYVGEQLEQRNA